MNAICNSALEPLGNGNFAGTDIYFKEGELMYLLLAFFLKKAVLMFNIGFSNLVDWSGRCEDSCGSTGQGRLHRRKATRRLPATARGKRSAWSGNQQPSLSLEHKKCTQVDCVHAWCGPIKKVSILID